MSTTTLLPYEPTTMSTAQLAAVSYLARYAGRTHHLFSAQLARWFTWCQSHGLDPLVGIQRCARTGRSRGVHQPLFAEVPSAPLKRAPCGSRTTPTPCAGTAS